MDDKGEIRFDFRSAKALILLSAFALFAGPLGQGGPVMALGYLRMQLRATLAQVACVCTPFSVMADTALITFMPANQTMWQFMQSELFLLDLTSMLFSVE
jgi:hypothetical protein